MEDLTLILIIVAVGVVIVTIVLAAFAGFRRHDRHLSDGRYRLQVYSELLHAVTELNLAGDDPYKIEQAKKHLAFTVNRLNLIASPGVLKSTSDLLDFLNEHMGKEFDTLRLHNILNSLVIEARRDLNYGHAKSIEEAKVRFRFFAPPRK